MYRKAVRGFVDLHCHWIAGIDDGARSPEEGIRMLQGLRAVGFDHVMATPHMRPGMFDNDKSDLEAAFAAMSPHLAARDDLPSVSLASEHFFDDVVFSRLVAGAGLPYPLEAAARGKKRGVLVELHPQTFPARLQNRLFDLARAGLRVVVAHPERYQPVWKDDAVLDAMFDAGALLLLDVCALVGKYGRTAEKTARKLLDEGAYEAACSDAHRPEDADRTGLAIEALERAVGKGEVERLLGSAPRALLGR